MTNGRSGIGPITAFDASDWPVRIAGEVKDWDPATALDRRAAKRMDRFVVALVASLEAAADAGPMLVRMAWETAPVWARALAGLLNCAMVRAAAGPRLQGLSPFIPRVLTNWRPVKLPALGARGPVVVSTACATGNHSIGEALRAIRKGDADLVIAGGAEPRCCHGYWWIHGHEGLVQHNDEPERASPL